MTGSGVTGGLVLAFSTAPDGPAVAARHEPCAGRLRGGGRPAVTPGWFHDDSPLWRARHDDGAAFVRLRRGKLVDDPSGQRVCDKTTEGPYEIACPGCGDDPGRDWSEISEELRRIRACPARSTAPGPRSWITSGCRPADSHGPALARRRAAELQPH